ncbi:fibropellin-1-like isoform X2 [Brachionus plicatilis]|uniref:Fibropellin-1-like isoform X2 n=1 Tax=Brachionus plicatilis TaxID=10195 RepID=A0A3M7RL01_BRAPC|nr:fibropellin-1-like isoform X2 [Brachionus plicatilis]
MKTLGCIISITLFLTASFKQTFAQTCENKCENGNCIDLNGVATCECFENYVGSKCDTIDPCLEKPCVSGACFPVIQLIQEIPAEQISYLCQCYTGFSGQNCDTYDLGACSSNPCLNSGKCIAQLSSRDYYCECVGPYIGQNCGTYVDYCANNRCENGATCFPQPDSKNYSCNCVDGFYGNYCEKEINECIAYDNFGNVTKICKNDGNCLDLIDGFICQCKTPWTGPTCEIYSNPCDSNPCVEGTICNVVGISYTCSCQPGYFGKPCQPNPCISNPCKKPGSKCIPIEAGAFPIISIPGCNITTPTSYVCICPGVSPEYGSQIC